MDPLKEGEMVVDASGIIGGVLGDEMSPAICFEGRKRGGGVRGWERSPNVDRHLPVAEPAVAPGLGKGCPLA